MGIHHINTIQNDVQSTNYSDKYIKEALANLGQRLGAKGDSILLESFNIELLGIGERIDNTDIYEITSNSFEDLHFEIINGETINTFDPNIGTFTNCVINKNEDALLYYFAGVETNESSENDSIVALQFNNNNFIVDGIVCKFIGNSLYVYRYGKNVDFKINYANNVNTGVILSNIFGTYFETHYDIPEIFENIKTNTDSELIEHIAVDNKEYIFSAYCGILPELVKEKFNNVIFNPSSTQMSYLGLKQYIVYRLFNHICSEFESTHNTTDIKLYIHKNYLFSYFVNSTSNNIYYGYDININFIDSFDIDNLTNYESIFQNKNIICEVLNIGINKIANYRFDVLYFNDEKYVNTITVNKNYTLPYIASATGDINKYWYLNDTKTDIRSTGDDAGNPGIFMLSYTKANDETTNIDILYAFTDEEKGILFNDFNNKLDSNKSTFKYKFIPTPGGSVQASSLINNELTNLDFEFSINLPDINAYIAENNAYENVFKNCILWTSIDVQLGANTSGESLGEILSYSSEITSYITVFWKVVKNNGIYNWEIIANNAFSTLESGNNIALDLGAMISIDRIANYITNTFYKPHKYFHSHVVFNDIVLSTKNNSSNKFIVNPVLTVSEIESIKDDVLKGTINAFCPAFINNENVEREINGTIKSITLRNNVDKVVLPTDCECIAYNEIDNVLQSSDSYNAPYFSFKEVLLLDQTNINRINILGINADKTIYNAFLGHKANTPVDELVLGTNAKNYNLIGNKTVGDDGEVGGEIPPRFETYKKLVLDLPTEINGLAINKICDNQYYAIISVDETETDSKYFTETKGFTTKYCKDANKVTAKTFKIKEYLGDTYGGFINHDNMLNNPISILNNTEGTKHMFILYLTGVENQTYKYNLAYVKEIQLASQLDITNNVQQN